MYLATKLVCLKEEEIYFKKYFQVPRGSPYSAFGVMRVFDPESGAMEELSSGDVLVNWTKTHWRRQWLPIRNGLSGVLVLVIFSVTNTVTLTTFLCYWAILKKLYWVDKILILFCCEQVEIEPVKYEVEIRPDNDDSVSRRPTKTTRQDVVLAKSSLFRSETQKVTLCR